MRVSFSLGVDATVVVEAWRYLVGEIVIIGSASPNEWLELETTNKDEIKTMFESCRHGTKGELAGETKIAVISFQQTPPGIPPYLVLAGLPQTINENN